MGPHMPPLAVKSLQNTVSLFWKSFFLIFELIPQQNFIPLFSLTISFISIISLPRKKKILYKILNMNQHLSYNDINNVSF